MPFTIPDNDVAGVPARQSPWYSTDIAILVAAIGGTGVLTGCDVTAQGSPNMTLAVSAPSPLTALYTPNAVPRREAGAKSATSAFSVPSAKP